MSNYENYKVSNLNPRDVFSSDENKFEEPNFDFINSTYEFNPFNKNDQKNTVEFNPFEDVPNEIFKPFNYAAIPPPDNFKATHDSNVFAPKQMQRVTQAHLYSSSNESEDSDNYENLVNHSSKSIGQNNFNDFKNETHTTPTNNSSLKNAPRNNDVPKKQMEKYKIENLSNSDYSESPLNEDFNDYFK